MIKPKINFISYLPWALLAVLYAPVFHQLYSSRWKLIDYTHAYFILPVALWLVWRKRTVLAAAYNGAKSKAGRTGLIWLILGILLFIFSWRNDYLMLLTLSFIVTTAGVTRYLYGKDVVRALRFPFLYLLLMVPPPLGILDAITLPMRYMTSIMVEVALRSFFLPITRSGLLLYAGGSEIYMGQPCSGFRSLIAMVSLGTVYAYLSKVDFKKKVILVISIVPLALFCNFLRVSAMCAATYYFGSKTGETVHDIGGYVVFGLLLLGMLGVENILERKKINAEE
jgi:exosortase